MLQDTAVLNAKGHVKLELYNEQGVFFTKEKKNLVVQSANEIVANMMADPAKVMRIKQVDKGDSLAVANSAGLYPFELTIRNEERVQVELQLSSSNTDKEFEIEGLKNLTKLEKVTAGSSNLLENKDVFLLDAETGKVTFAVAPTENVTFICRRVKNPFMKVISGTETVKVQGVAWTRSDVADKDAHTYQVSYETGEILFAAPVTQAEVSYDYHMNYCLGFMALGGKPSAAHPNFQPVEFGNSNKLDVSMQNELAGSRMPVNYPSSVTNGAIEVDPSIPTKPISSALKTASIAVVTEADAVTKKLTYVIPNTHDSGSGATPRLLLELVSVKNLTTNNEIISQTTISSNTLSSVSVSFADAVVSIGDNVQVEYRLKLDNSHLIYQLGQAPAVKLISVRHINAADSSVIKEYLVKENGLVPNQGDVWISNPNTGHITFSANPTGGPQVHTPGQLQVEYMVNSGTVVRFVADFPKGVPAPVLEDTEKVVTVAAGQTSIALNQAIAKNDAGNFIEPTVTVNRGGTSTVLTSAQYTISIDGKAIIPNSLASEDIVTVEYQYEKTSHDIYQVAMFDNKEGGKMFNISGIGPVTKDKNTGMRITWSVTF